MSKTSGAQHSAFSGTRTRGLDLRAIDRLGIKLGHAVARSALHSWSAA